jgi:hypothetical protein
MTNAGRERSRADPGDTVETIVSTYLAECGGDPLLALRRVVGDALADLLEMERRSRRVERLISRGYVRRSVGLADEACSAVARDVGK